MAVLLTRPGLRRARTLNVSPTGENARPTCKFFFTFETKKLVLASGLSGIPTDFARLRWNREYFPNPPSERGLEFNH